MQRTREEENRLTKDENLSNVSGEKEEQELLQVHEDSSSLLDGSSDGSLWKREESERERKLDAF